MNIEKHSITSGKKHTLVLEASGSASHAIELESGADAEVLLVNLAPESEDVELHVDARIGNGASLLLVGCHVGGKETKYTVNINQQGKSRCEHNEICLLGANQRLFARTSHTHTAPGSFSRTHFRCAASGNAYVDVEGAVEIEQKAKGSDANFVAKNLLLSRDARVRLVPMLNVRTGNVKAGHGAAMAPVSADELFYLGSRGIEDSEGRRMIITGFLLEALLASKPGRKIAAGAEKSIARKLGALDGI